MGHPPMPPSRLEAINQSLKTLWLLWSSEPYTLLSICAITSPLTMYFPSCSINIWIKKRRGGGFLGGSAVKKSPANAGDVGLIPALERFPGGEKATHFNNTFAWEIPWTEEPAGQQSVGSQGEGHDLAPEQWQQSFKIFSLSRELLGSTLSTAFLSNTQQC